MPAPIPHEALARAVRAAFGDTTDTVSGAPAQAAISGRTSHGNGGKRTAGVYLALRFPFSYKPPPEAFHLTASMAGGWGDRL